MKKESPPLTVLCLACYFKGTEFIRECKRRGSRVYLLTSEKLANAAWPREYLDDIFLASGDDDGWNIEEVIQGVSYHARSIQFDRIVALDDYDLEKAAALREHLRIAGYGHTRTRYFRDKLSMRMRARDGGILVPDFVHVLNHDRIRRFAAEVAPPWVLKPRSEASSVGIKKIGSESQLWQAIEELGDLQSFYVLEKFLPGDIFHVDSLVFEDQVVFARAHRYVDPPMQVAHEGGIFCSYGVAFDSQEDRILKELNNRIIATMGHKNGVSHTEFIRSHADGRYYFLETTARVAGAHLVEMIEASSGINMWAEWAKIETSTPQLPYSLPSIRDDYAGIIISLSRQEQPDTGCYDDPEIVWRLDKASHAGLIVRSGDLERVKYLIAQYTQRFLEDFHTVMPIGDKPSD